MYISQEDIDDLRDNLRCCGTSDYIEIQVDILKRLLDEAQESLWNEIHE